MTARHALALVVMTVVAAAAMSACGTTTTGTPQAEPITQTSSTQPNPVATAETASASPSSSAKSQAAVPVPAAAWISADRIPQNSDQPWPDLADRAEPLGTNTFRLYGLCGATPSPIANGDNARAVVDNGDGHWSAEQVIVHYPGDPWTMGQTVSLDAANLQNVLTQCTSTAPGTTLQFTTPVSSRCPSVARGGCHQVAAEIRSADGQSTAHVYLANVGSTITELTVWANGTPSTPWAGAADEEVFAAMNPQLCTVWEC
jgi:hypothetical protein